MALLLLLLLLLPLGEVFRLWQVLVDLCQVRQPAVLRAALAALGAAALPRRRRYGTVLHVARRLLCRAVLVVVAEIGFQSKT